MDGPLKSRKWEGVRRGSYLYGSFDIAILLELNLSTPTSVLQQQYMFPVFHDAYMEVVNYFTNLCAIDLG